MTTAVSTINTNRANHSPLVGISDREFTVTRRDDDLISATFRFEDNRWFLLNILRPHESNFEATITFTSLKKWLRLDAKLYIAHLWLETTQTALQFQQTMQSLRDLGRLLPEYSGKPIDLNIQHANEFVRRYCALNLSTVSNAAAQRRINRFMAFVRQQHPDGNKNNFKLTFPKTKTRSLDPQPLEQAQEKSLSTEVLSAIIDACTADLNAYYKAKLTYIDQGESREKYRAYQRRRYHERRKKIRDGSAQRLGYTLRMVQLHSRAIKGQALILALCVGRRAAAICNTSFNVKAEKVDWTNDSGQQEKAVLVRFRERKLRNVDEDVACPDAFGELALKAISTAKELTAELRACNPQWKDFLFLVPTRKRDVAKVIRVRQLNEYLNGQHGNNAGICQRYNIPVSGITIHNFRATRATKTWLGGLQVHEVAYDLGHVNADMTVRHYIVGRDEDRRRLQVCMDKGALSGALEDIVAGREMVRMRLEARHVEIMKRQGRMLSPNRYGYCALPATSGPCTRTTPCYIGPGARGGGCDHHVLSPDALPALEEDRELLLTNLKTYQDDPAYSIWVQHQQVQLNVIDSKISEAEILKSRIEN